MIGYSVGVDDWHDIFVIVVLRCVNCVSLLFSYSTSFIIETTSSEMLTYVCALIVNIGCNVAF